MQIVKFEVGGFGGSNAYLLWDDETKDAVIIDPGYPDERFEQVIKENGLNVNKILLTHGHFDHIGGVQQLRDLTNAPVYIPEKDADFLTTSSLNLSGMAGMPGGLEFDPAEVLVKDGDVIEISPNLSLTAIELPGHTPGSTAFVGDGFVVVGDVLFKGSIGRTDFPNGSYADMMDSLQRLTQLPDDYTVLPGHGDITTILSEKTTNPFLV